jgi:serine/threonine-protein kinase
MDRDPSSVGGITHTVAVGDNNVSCADLVAIGTPTPRRVRTPRRGSVSRYRINEVIGAGGMGEVVSAQDEQIGRAVAIKRMRTQDAKPEAIARFLREARIQGRLEHPAVVPVHELQLDDEGHPFFVMKQLTGTTLAAALAKPDAAASRGRHLRAFVDVCLAIEFAHTRGIVHRDLKPSNIMLGDFGDVHVLDWGIARVVGDQPSRAAFHDVIPLEGDCTKAGTVLGTPGYMAPEQLRGIADLDARADLYALGCVLFELLARRPLHPDRLDAVRATLVGVDARPSMHDPDVPPELDAICVRATKLDRNDRYPTARALGEAVQQFLDGDRDVALREQLARTELEAARCALASEDTLRGRQTAMRAAARALALDPTSREPADLVARLMLEPPRASPLEVVDRMAQLDVDALQAARRHVRLATAALTAFAPVAWLMGLRGWPLVFGFVVPCVVAIATYVVPRSRETTMWRFALSGWLLTIASLSITLTPFSVMQGLVVVVAVLAAVTPPAFIRAWVLIALVVTAALTPWFLTLIDVLPRDFAVVGNTIVLTHAGDHLDPTITQCAVTAAIMGLTTIAVITVRSIVNDRRDSQRKVEIQAWQLRQLVSAQD